MERTNSRRRKFASAEPVTSELTTTTNSNTSTTASNHGAASVRRSSWRLRLVPALLILLLFLLLTALLLSELEITPIGLGYFTSSNKSPGEEYGIGIGIPLHPQDHIHRAPATLTFDWHVTKGFRSPDGVRKEVYLINDQFPGPVIEARSGDRIVVNVTNCLRDEGLAIHWHGLRMKGANAMDGAVGITQNPLPSGESFLYNFTIGDDEFGTFWYHGHEKTQRDDGLYGGFIIHRPVKACNEAQIYNYEKEILLLIGDWYHRPSTQVLSWYMNSRSFGNEPVPDSLLVNGKGDFDCEMAVPARPVECTPPAQRADIPLLRFKRGTRQRIRVVNTGSLTGFSMAMDAASITPFQVDGGNNITSVEAQRIGIVYPGERVDAIVLIGGSDKQRHLTIEMDDENFKYPNPALEPVQTFPVTASPNRPHEVAYVPPELEYFNLQAAVSSSSNPDVQSEPMKFVVYTTTMKLARHHNIPMGFMNHTSWSPQPEPLISIPRSEYDQNQLSPHIPFHLDNPSTSPNSDTWVEIVINNLDDGGHPFHLHGYSFYVVSVFPPPIPFRSEKPPFTPGGTALYNYNPFVASPSESPGGMYNLDNPVMRDTFFVPQRGYAVIRFPADNKGIWMMHCHVGWHLGSGMAMTWDVS
jgi:FtsP/CotA-like multicopper oxidase with cupredoxin domain